jgi:hypothetical protein
MTTIPALVMIAAFGQTPVDPAELAKAQSALESYLTRVKTLHITYTKSWTPADVSAYRRTNPNWDSTLSDHHDLLYAFPSLRMKVVERQKDGDGRVTEQQREVRFHQGKKVDVDYTNKQFHTITSSDPDPLPALPVIPIGLRVLHTLNAPISDLLKFPHITSFEGSEDINGEPSIVLKIGPQIPHSARPSAWNDNTFVRLSLAINRSYLPLRSEIIHSLETMPDANYLMSIDSFEPTRDMARGNSIPFPRHMEIKWPSGAVTSWTVKTATINPEITSHDFALTPPPGYFVTLDSKPQAISGGIEVRNQRVEQSLEDARRLLGSLEPPRSSDKSSFVWPIGAVFVACVLIAAAFLLKWRIGR